MLAKRATCLWIVSVVSIASSACYAMDFEYRQGFEFWDSALYSLPSVMLDRNNDYAHIRADYSNIEKADYIDLDQIGDPAIGAGFAEVGLYTIESLKIDRTENLAGEQNYFRDDPDGFGFFIRKRFE